MLPSDEQETYIGDLEKNRHRDKKQKPGGGAKGNVSVLGMKEREGRVKAIGIEDGEGETLQKFVCENIIPGTTLFTDENHGYVHLDDEYGANTSMSP